MGLYAFHICFFPTKFIIEDSRLAGGLLYEEGIFLAIQAISRNKRKTEKERKICLS